MRSKRVIGVASVATVLLMVLAAFAAVPGAGAKDEVVTISIIFNGDIDEGIVEDLGGEVVAKVPYIDGLTATVKKSDVAKLKKDSKVKLVELDTGASIDKPNKKPPGGTTSYLPPAPELQWGVNRIDADLVWDEDGYISPTLYTVAVVDTGVKTSHPDFPSGIFVSGWDFVNDDDDPDDDNGHGTHCAGIIAADISNSMTVGDKTTDGVVGVAYDVNIMPVKVLNSGGSGYWTWIAAGIRYAADHGADVISLSLGGSDSTIVHQAIAYAIIAKNVVVVASAGNEGKRNTNLNNVGYPARYPEVIAVGAIDANDARATFSSTGTGLDVMAPGVGIWSTYRDLQWRSMSGTSMACPHVAGTVALVLANRIDEGGWTPAEIHDLLNDTSESSWTGWNKAFGYGIVDAYEAVYGG